MKNLYYYNSKVIAYEDSIPGEIIVPGAGTSVFIGEDRSCRNKVKELNLDYGDFDLAPIVIPPCTPRQIRLWLLSLGVNDDMIISQINSIPDVAVRSATLIEYKYALQFERSHPFVDAIGASLGLNADQIDVGFEIASTL